MPAGHMQRPKPLAPAHGVKRQGACLQEGTWAGQQELVALARDLRLRLRVYQAGQPSWVLAPDFPDFPKAWPQPAHGTHLSACACLPPALAYSRGMADVWGV